MLVLSRKSGQKIIINDGEIEIIVFSEKNSMDVKLGFNASQKFHIVREELQDKYTSEKRRVRA